MKTIRVLHSKKDEIDILTFYEHDLPFGSMAIAGFAKNEAPELSISDVRALLPKREELWWDSIGFEIRGGGVRIYFKDCYQEADSVRPNVPKICNLVWGSTILLRKIYCYEREEERRRHEKYIEIKLREIFSRST